MASNQNPAKQNPAILADEEFNKKWDQEALYKNIKKVNDPRFGEITIVKNDNVKEILFVKEKMASSKQEATNDIRELKSRIALNHPHLQKLVNYSTTVKKELCSTHYLSRGFYEFPHSDTYKEHLERKRNGRDFTSFELTHLAYQILDGLNHLHSRNITHGDIRPLHIGYQRETGQFQILDRLADPSPLEKLQGANIVNKKDLFISPELWKKLQGKDKTWKYNAYKNDLYALGLSILFLGNSDSIQDVYKPNGEFDQNRLNEHISKFNSKYQNENPYLCTIVKTLLAPSEADRPDGQQLINNLIPYDQYRNQESQGIRVQGGVSPDVYAVDNQANNQDFFNYQPQVTTQAQAQPDRVIINRSDYANTNEASKNQGNVSGLNTTTDNTQVSYSYANPNVTYTYAQPVTTYSYAQPTTYTYAHAEPGVYNTTNVNYVQVEPNYTHPTGNVYYQTDPSTYTYIKPNATFVNANVEPPKGEIKTSANYVPPVERKSYTQYVTGPDGVKVARRSYTHYVARGEGVTTDQVGTNPTTYYYTQPTVTYVQGAPIVERKSYTQVAPTTYTQATPVTYVQGTPTYTYTQPTATVYTNFMSYNKDERKVSNPEAPQNVDGKNYDGVHTYQIGQPYTISSDDKHVIYQTNPTTTYTQYTPSDNNKVYTTYATPNVYYQGDQPTVLSNNVEIRKGSSAPTEPETKVIKKRYILQGDQVIEVNAEQEHS